MVLTETRLTFNANKFLHNTLKVRAATSGLRDADGKGNERKAAHPIIVLKPNPRRLSLVAANLL